MRKHVEGTTVNRSAMAGSVIDFAGLRVHMIGVGGSGMSGAAALLLEIGAHVSGSDLTVFGGMGDLVRRGARVVIGHQVQQLASDVDLVVISAAIPASNPELSAARRRGLRVMKYAELLGHLMAHHNGVALAGTHGKSTTSALCVHLFRQGGLDPSYVIGARSEVLGGSSGVGAGKHFVVEACEYDRSFLHLRPKSGAVLNVEPDHLDYFGDFDHVVEAFARFADRISAAGLLVCNAEDRWARQAASHAKARVETFGFEAGADWRAVNLQQDRGRYAFDVRHHARIILSTRMTIPGRHNVANALAAIALAHDAGVDPRAIAEACPTFPGVSRRLSWRGKGRGVTIVDDYAHHPTEVRAAIEAIKSRYQPRRIWVVFQPHQHFRTRVFMDDFADSFGLADEIIVSDIYGAREVDGPQGRDGSEELVVRICSNGGRVRHLATLEAVTEHLTRHVTEGELVLTMGAGDVWKVADELVERFCGTDGTRGADRASDLVSPGGSRAVFVSSA